MVAKVKNLVALAPVLGAISRPETYIIQASKQKKTSQIILPSWEKIISETGLGCQWRTEVAGLSNWSKPCLITESTVMYMCKVCKTYYCVIHSETIIITKNPKTL